MAWWIASWADDEQYKEEQPREGLFLAGATWFWLVDSRLLGLVFLFYDALPWGWLVLFIGKGPGPLPKY